MMLRKPSSVSSTIRSRREIVSGGAYAADWAAARRTGLDWRGTSRPRTRPFVAGGFAGVAIALSFAYVLLRVVVSNGLAFGGYIHFVYKSITIGEQDMISPDGARDQDSTIPGADELSCHALRVWTAVTAAAAPSCGLLLVRS